MALARSVRTSLVLLALAGLLLGYILLVDRGSVSSSQLEQRKDAALPELTRKEVAKVELQHKGHMLVLVRDPDDPDEGGLWRVQAPYKAKADQQLVNDLLASLDTLDTKRRIESVTAADRKRFGLDAPRYRLWLSQGRLRIPITVGGESPQGDGIYLQAANPALAFVVGKDLLDDLAHDPLDYHTKELHDGALVSTSRALSLRDAQGERAVRKRDDGLWELQPPDAGLASAPVIGEAIDALDGLRAKHFVAQNVKDLARYGLDHPRFELTLHMTRLLGEAAKDEKGKPKREQVALRLRVGAACAAHPGESYVLVDDSGSVSCAADEDLKKLQKSRDELREARLLPLDDDEVQGVQLEQGAQRLTLRKADKTWSYEAARSSGHPLSGLARADAVSGWLKALRETKAVRFAPAASAPLPQPIVLRVERGKDKRPYEVRLHPEAGELMAQRIDEPGSLAFPAEALELLQPQAARFRPLSVLHFDESSLRAIELQRGSQHERVARADSGSSFEIQAPLHAPADTVVLEELARLLSSLQAVRYVADAPAPSDGLGPAALVVKVERNAAPKDSAPASFSLRLGAQAEGGRYAELAGSPGVFVAPAQLAQDLAEPLVSRTLLSTPLEQIQSIELQQGKRRVRVTRQGQSFQAGGAAALSNAAATALARAIATLRASHASGYGAASKAQGFSPPFARLVVTQTGGQSTAPLSHTISIGADAGDGARYARRDDQPVTFVLPKASVSALTSAAEH